MIGDLNALDWVVAGAAAVSLYVLVNMWLAERRGWTPAPDTEE
jgi:hypothetical protein